MTNLFHSFYISYKTAQPRGTETQNWKISYLIHTIMIFIKLKMRFKSNANFLGIFLAKCIQHFVYKM